jgi:uncharacterized damage-inducible protein DinB
LDELEDKWKESLNLWLAYLNSTSEDELFAEVEFRGWSGGDFAAKPKDIALQLNYHSIHHRAQIQTIIRHQGIKPDSIEYINSNYRASPLAESPPRDSAQTNETSGIITHSIDREK